MGWPDIGAASALAMVIVTTVIYLHTRSADKIRELEEKIDAATSGSEKAHRILGVQIADLGLSVAQNYVRREDLREAMNLMNANIIETKSAIVEIRQLLYRRNGGSSV